MMYALMTYKAYPAYNVGDYIQSLAAARFLPRIDSYICREKLSLYRGGPVKTILNGWFMHQPQNWPPAKQITPKIISFHINSKSKQSLLSGEGREWFREHEPIGCRDLFTLQAMQQAGVDAYLSGCLTSTLKNKWNYRTNDVYFVDVLFRIPDYGGIFNSPRSILRSVLDKSILRGSERRSMMEKLFDKEIIEQAINLNHYHPASHTERERFDMAECFLEKYATAKLVVTSRLHCAIPCLAFGTPVVFVDGGFEKEEDWCRFNGVTNLFNLVSIRKNGCIESNFNWSGERIGAGINLQNPAAFRSFVPGLEKACADFVKQDIAIT